MECENNMPYPEIITNGKNLTYAALLLKDYAGAEGELTAILQYFYQHVISEEYSEISKTLKCIALVEMHHMGILADLIKAFGGDPQMRIYSKGRPIYWSTKYVDYSKNPKRFLMNNIRSEKAAIAAYKQRLRQIDDQEAQKVIERIILDEEEHIKIFEKLLKIV